MLSRVQRGVEEAAARVIDAVADKGECDFVTDIASPFPIRIICEIMGIPESQHAFVFCETNKILGLGDPEYTLEATDLASQLMGAGAALAELVNDLRRQRLEAPAEDHPNPHVGFGAGPHFCLGANLARPEITVMFRELFRRLPDLEVSDEPVRLASAFIHGIKHMPCRFAPVSVSTR